MKNSVSTAKKSPKMNLVLRVYVYVFIGVGILMMSIGAYGFGQNLYKRLLLPKYPLGYEETRCDYIDISPVPMKLEGYTEVEVKELRAQNLKQAEVCRTNLEAERQVRRVTDLYNSIIVFVIGAVLFSAHLWVNLKTESKK